MMKATERSGVSVFGCVNKNAMEMLIELNVLFPYGPNNVNRDGNGIMKQLTVGGDPRARQASQAKKYPIRENFPAYKTRAIVDVLMDKAQERGLLEGKDPKVIKQALAVLTESTYDQKSGKAQSSQNTSYSLAEVDALFEYFAGMDDAMVAALAESDKLPDEIREVRDAMVAGVSVEAEIALFGRMTTAGIGSTVASAVHFNHLYSIDEFASEYDYFSSLDNYLGESAHLNSFSMGSNTMYGYMNVDPVQMYENLALSFKERGLSGKELEMEQKKAAAIVRDSVLKLLKDYMTIHPVGKQNSMASTPVPSAVFLSAVRHGFPCTMDNIFNGAIHKYREKSIATIGAERMADYIREDMPDQDYALQAFFADSQVRATGKLDLPESIPCQGLKAINTVLDELGGMIDKVLADVMQRA